MRYKELWEAEKRKTEEYERRHCLLAQALLGRADRLARSYQDSHAFFCGMKEPSSYDIYELMENSIRMEHYEEIERDLTVLLFGWERGIL